MLLFFPSLAGGVHMAHDLKRKGSGGGVCVRLSGHVADALAKARVAQGDCGISVHQKLVDCLAFGQTRQGSVLPKNRRHVALCSHQAVVANHQGAVAQVKALVEYFPKGVKVAVGRASDVNQVERDNALVESSVILGLSGLPVLGAGHVVVAVRR